MKNVKPIFLICTQNNHEKLNADHYSVYRHS